MKQNALPSLPRQVNSIKIRSPEETEPQGKREGHTEELSHVPKPRRTGFSLASENRELQAGRAAGRLS